MGDNFAQVLDWRKSRNPPEETTAHIYPTNKGDT